MNLEDLILDTQISELKRLQTRCTEARSGIAKIRTKLAALNEQSEKSLSELRVRHTEELDKAVGLLDVEAQKHRDHAVASSDSLKVAARQNRERLLGELHSRLQQDIAEARRTLRADLEALQLLDERQLEVELAETNAAGTGDSIPVALVMKPAVDDLASAELEPAAVDLETAEPTVSAAAEPVRKRRKGSRKSKAIGQSSSEGEKSSEVSGQSTTAQPTNDDAASERVDFDEADLSPKQAPQRAGWTGGWRLFVLCSLIFVLVTIVVALSRIDLGTAMSFVFSEADLMWAGISALAGLGAALLIGLMLRFVGSRKRRTVVSTTSKAIKENVVAEPESVSVPSIVEENAGQIVSDISLDDSVEFAVANDRVAASDHQATAALSVNSLVSLIPSGGVAARSDVATSLVFAERFQKAIKLQAASDALVNDLIRRYTEQVGFHVEKVEDQVINGSNATAEALQSIDAWRSQELVRIQQHYKVEFDRVQEMFLQDARTEPQRLTEEAKVIHSRWKANFTIASELARIICERATVYPAWSEMVSKPWSAPTAVPVTLTVGDIRATFPAAPDYPDGDINSELIMDLPGVVNFPQNCSIAVQHDAVSRESSLKFIDGLLLRFVTSLAPKAAKLSVIDPIERSAYFDGIAQLAEFNSQLIDVCSSDEDADITNRLQEITDRIESVQLACLQSDSKSIHEHNAKGGATPVPYHFVVLTGFSKKISDASGSLLTNILNEGPRCGIYTIVVWSSDQETPRSFDLSSVRDCCVLFHATNGSVQPGLPPSQGSVEHPNRFVEFKALTPPDATVYARLIAAVGEQCRGEGAAEITPDQVPPLVAAEASEAASEVAEVAVIDGEDKINVANNIDEAGIAVNEAAIEAIDISAGSNEVMSDEESVAISEVGQSEAIVEEFVSPTDEGRSADAMASDSVEPTVASMPAEDNAIPARMENCAPLTELLAGTFADARISSGEVAVWLGEKDASNAAFGIKFQRSRGQNLLIVGQDRELAGAILASAVISVCSGSTPEGKPRSACMVLLHDEMDEPSFGKFTASFPKELVPGLTMRGAGDAETLVAALLREITTREAAKGKFDSPEIIFAVRDVGQFPFLRREDDSSGTIGFGSSKPSASKLKFSDLIRRGPQVGIHVVLWADTLTSAMQLLSHSLLREFDSRIALCMNADDSKSLIGNAEASSLSAGRAIFYVDPAGASEKFRPFEWPLVEWLSAAARSPGSHVNEVATFDRDGATGGIPGELELVEKAIDEALVPEEVASDSSDKLKSEAGVPDVTEVSASDSFVLADSIILRDAPTQVADELSVLEAPVFVEPASADSVPDFVVSADVSAAATPLLHETATAIPVADLSQVEAPVAEPKVSKATAVSFADESLGEVPGVSSKALSKSLSMPASEPLVETSRVPSPVVAKPAPSIPKSPAVPPTPVAQGAQPASSPPVRQKKPSAMAARLAARNSDPSRPLDAPPERLAQSNPLSAPNQPAPETQFDELDFDSLMIE